MVLAGDSAGGYLAMQAVLADETPGDAETSTVEK